MIGRDWWRKYPVELRHKSCYATLRSGVALCDTFRACRAAIFRVQPNVKSGFVMMSQAKYVPIV